MIRKLGIRQPRMTNDRDVNHNNIKSVGNDKHSLSE